MKTTVESLVVRLGTNSVFYFERGPTLKEIARLAIAGQVVDIVLTKIKHRAHSARQNITVSLCFLALEIDVSCDEPRFIFEARIVSYWPLATGGVGERCIQGCLDQNRQGLFIFCPNAYGVHLM